MFRIKKFAICLTFTQVVFIILFGIFVDYDTPALPQILLKRDNEIQPTFLEHYYPMFQDVHVMIFIGFGYLFTFLKRYSYSAIGVNMFLSALLIQWAILCEGFFALKGWKIKLTIEKLLTADVSAAAALISWGALLGKTSPLQLLAMVLVEIPLFALNEWLTLEVYKASDPGASIICHTFGAYFGLAASLVLYQKYHKGSTKEGAIYHSDVFAMIGTVFLWLFWPSFNAALTHGDDRHRAVINTYLSLASCCITTFAVSSLVDGKNRFSMIHIQNATLAGGVAMGTACATMMRPCGALIIGAIAAVTCTLGFKYLTPLLANRLRLHDTCGVNNLHGMMGIFGGIIGAVMATMATKDMYGPGLHIMYPAMEPRFNFSAKQPMSITSDFGRSAATQAGFQLIAVITTLAIAVLGGLLAGVIMRWPLLDPPDENQIYDDVDYWELADNKDGHPNVEDNGYSSQNNHHSTTTHKNSLTVDDHAI